MHKAFSLQSNIDSSWSKCLFVIGLMLHKSTSCFMKKKKIAAVLMWSWGPHVPVICDYADCLCKEESFHLLDTIWLMRHSATLPPRYVHLMYCWRLHDRGLFDFSWPLGTLMITQLFATRPWIVKNDESSDANYLSWLRVDGGRGWLPPGLQIYSRLLTKIFFSQSNVFMSWSNRLFMQTAV